MPSIEKRLRAFACLGEIMGDFVHQKGCESGNGNFLILESAVARASASNQWFSQDNIHLALSSLSGILKYDILRKWIAGYVDVECNDLKNNKSDDVTVAVVMAGNIPLVGFHDFFCVLMSGHRILIKLSSDDQFLLPALSEILIGIEPLFEGRINFSRDKLSGFDAVIATGSNNSSRYFEYYFSGYPHIIRKGRSSIAVLSGQETDADLKNLCEDMFSYFGLGCRSVSKLLAPAEYDFNRLLEIATGYVNLARHNKYGNNYDYYKSIFLINRVNFLDNGVFLLVQDNGLNSPVSVVYFEYYSNRQEVINYIEQNSENLQCVVSQIEYIPDRTDFGRSQCPNISDYADGTDTMKFLKNLFR